MKLVLGDLKFEADKLTVRAEQEAATRDRRKLAGWKLQPGRVERADGKLELTFVRRKVGRIEVTP